MSPTPFSLLCALLLTLPLAVIFTITTSPFAITTPPSLPFPTNQSFLDPLVTPPPPKTQKPTSEITNTFTFPLPLPLPLSSQVQSDEEDNSLTQLASRVNPYPSSPKKLSFLFLTTTLLPLSPLWELYFNQTTKNLYNIYIHADPSFHYDDPQFQGVFFNRTIPSKPTGRNIPPTSALIDNDKATPSKAGYIVETSEASMPERGCSVGKKGAN